MGDLEKGGCLIGMTPPDEAKGAGPLAPVSSAKVQVDLDLSIERRSHGDFASQTPARP
ncbi:hypothetical protein DF3PB_5390001 [uncultured Defluviicoccus sp.]|uniref:Uncharacterized protein n=1 Tax=metagenome TaxID=256318 RepID=A0A380TJR9_9ZZZZ|nr:hypothetical protein DF3PB_5390001 [uncultured Defluviicoccus sp.]